MNKKIIIGSISLVIMLVCLTAISAVTAQRTNDVMKNSPLFNLRANRSIGKENSINRMSFLNSRICIYFAFSNQYNLKTRNLVINKENTFLDQTTCAGTDTCNPRRETCLAPTCTLTCSKLTILCGSCTQRLICKTLSDNC